MQWDIYITKQLSNGDTNIYPNKWCDAKFDLAFNIDKINIVHSAQQCCLEGIFVNSNQVQELGDFDLIQNL